jgi:hypothetical protein
MGGTARARVKVVAPGPNPLAGVWSQVQTPTCVGPGGPILELILRRSGGLRLTVRPFQTYVDVVGTWTLVWAPGRSARPPPCWNSAVPPARQTADCSWRATHGCKTVRITLADRVDRVGPFAAMPGEERCRAVFRRAGDAPQPRRHRGRSAALTLRSRRSGALPPGLAIHPPLVIAAARMISIHQHALSWLRAQHVVS